MKTISLVLLCLTLVSFGLVFTSFGGDTNEPYELTPLPTRVYNINGETFMPHLKQLITPKSGESNQDLLLRYFKDQHIEIKKPAALIMVLEGDSFLIVRTTAHDLAEIKRLLSNDFGDIYELPKKTPKPAAVTPSDPLRGSRVLSRVPDLDVSHH